MMTTATEEITCPRFYVVMGGKDGRTPVIAEDEAVWAAWYNSVSWQAQMVANTWIGPYRIATEARSILGSRDEAPFETTIVRCTCDDDEAAFMPVRTWRSRSWEDAERQHRLACEWLTAFTAAHHAVR